MKRRRLILTLQQPDLEDEALREYNRQIEKFIRIDVESGRSGQAWSWVIRPEQRKTHPSRNQAEQVGLACLRGLGSHFVRVGFAVRQTRRKTGWRLLFFVVERLA